MLTRPVSHCQLLKGAFRTFMTVVGWETALILAKESPSGPQLSLFDNCIICSPFLGLCVSTSLLLLQASTTFICPWIFQLRLVCSFSFEPVYSMIAFVFITASFFNLSFEFTLLICLITGVALYSFFNPIGPCPHRDLGWKGWCFLTSSASSPFSQPPTLAPTSLLSYCSFLSVTLKLNIKTPEGTLCLLSTIH